MLFTFIFIDFISKSYQQWIITIKISWIDHYTDPIWKLQSYGIEKERIYIVCSPNYSENALHNESGIYDMNTWLQLSGVYNTLECQRHDNQQSILNSKWLLTKESCWAPSNSRKVNPLPFTILWKKISMKDFLKINFRPSKPRWIFVIWFHEFHILLVYNPYKEF